MMQDFYFIMFGGMSVLFFLIFSVFGLTLGLFGLAFGLFSGALVLFAKEFGFFITTLGFIYLATVAVLIVKLFLYPYFVAKQRNHNNAISVFIVSLIPFIGTLGSLAWAFSNDIDKSADRKLTDKQIIFHAIKILIYLILSTIIAASAFCILMFFKY